MGWYTAMMKQVYEHGLAMRRREERMSNEPVDKMRTEALAMADMVLNGGYRESDTLIELAQWFIEQYGKQRHHNEA